MRYTFKPVYKSQPWGIAKVAFVERWHLFGASETNLSDFHGTDLNWP